MGGVGVGRGWREGEGRVGEGRRGRGVAVGGGGCPGLPLQTPHLLPCPGWMGPHRDQWAFLRGL